MADGERHYVLWLINAVQDWHKPTLLGAITGAKVDGIDAITAELGDREAPGNNSRGIDINDHEAAKLMPGTAGRTEYTALGALMHEGGHLTRDRLTDKKRSGHLFDEYFVPIPVKCLGDPKSLSVEVDALRPRLTKPRTSGIDQAALARLLASYDEYFGSGRPHHFTRYWDRGFTGAPTAASSTSGTLREVRMHSKAYHGYYGMLVRWNAREGHKHDRHILLGYSQGGTVGRFVSYLDEHVFGLGLVHGVITVQSPNYGSPVARSANAAQLEAVLRARLPALHAVAWLVRPLAPADLAPLVTWLLAEAKNEATQPQSSRVTINALDQKLAETIVHIRGRITSGQASSPATSLELVAMLVSARKWISGLCSKRSGIRFAFADLNPERICVDGTKERVVRLINAPGHVQVPHAAIIGCNPSLEALFGGGALGLLAKLLGSLAGLSLTTLTDEFKTVFDERDRLPTNPAPEYQELADHYRAPIAQIVSGVGGPIAAMSHDCVIPSGHQLMYGVDKLGGSKQAFLGNFINLDANHASGTALSDRRPTDLEYVVRVLSALPARDP